MEFHFYLESSGLAKPNQPDQFLCLWKQTSQVWNSKNQKHCLTIKLQFYNNLSSHVTSYILDMGPTFIRVTYLGMHAYIASYNFLNAVLWWVMTNVYCTIYILSLHT